MYINTKGVHMGKKLTKNEVQQKIMDNFEQPIVLISEYTGKRNNIALQCQTCGHTWTTRAANVLYINTHRQVSHHCPNCYKEQFHLSQPCARDGTGIHTSLRN